MGTLHISLYLISVRAFQPHALRSCRCGAVTVDGAGAVNTGLFLSMPPDENTKTIGRLLCGFSFNGEPYDDAMAAIVPAPRLLICRMWRRNWAGGPLFPLGETSET